MMLGCPPHCFQSGLSCSGSRGSDGDPALREQGTRGHERRRAQAGGHPPTSCPESEERPKSRQAGSGLTWAQKFRMIWNPKSAPTTYLNNKHSFIPSVEDAKMRNLQDIEAKLKENKNLLNERFNVKEIGIFGSFVRGEQKETSDLDILVEFEGRASLFEIVRLERFLSELLGEKVDLVMKNSLKPRIGKHILREVVYV